MVQSSCLIHALSKLSVDVVGKLIEDEEESRNIATTVRRKLVNKLINSVAANGGTMMEACANLFSEIQRFDNVNDGYINRTEFKLLLLRLDIYFSARKVDDAFAQFDKDANGSINSKEFSDFIFEMGVFEVRK